MRTTRGVTSLHVRVLGEIEAVGGKPQLLGGPMQRRVFAALVARRGETVSVSQLVEVCWTDEDRPDRAEHNVRTYVHRLRSALGDDGHRIETASAGYRLNLQNADLDIDRFEELTSSARQLVASGEFTDALDRLEEAKALWRGQPYGEFAETEWAMPEAARLTELHWVSNELYAEAQLAAGRPASAVTSLEAMIREEPLRERPRALLMRALYESGRQVEALRAFQAFRGVLVDEIGVEPSQDLVELDQAIASGQLESAGTKTRVVGSYELKERIGEGAFAIVHRATQESLGREVAVKVVRAELANRPEFIRRFEAEARMVAAIEHPNIVPLYDFWREPGQAFLVMRWMAGGSLETRLDSGPFTLEATVDMVDQIAAALTASHDHGVVHRDVKPANILFDNSGRAYLGDFGIALAATEQPHPQAALSEGSPVFAAPEQLRRETVGPEADVFALATVAFTALAGRAPFADAQNEAELLRRQLGQAIPAISSVRSGLPPELDGVLGVATAKLAADRYPSAGGFAAAFRAAAHGDDISDSPVIDDLERINPYLGLRAFSETDSAAFHGRARLVDELVAHIAKPDNNLLAIVGPSGSGKSSVVSAGLIPALRQGRVPGSEKWFTTTMQPGDHPFEALETALLRVAVNPPASLLGQLRDGDRGVLRSATRILPDDDGVLIIVIDQFEELYTTDIPAADRDLFLRALSVAATEPLSRVRVVLTLRADFYDEPLRHPEFAPLIKRHTHAITPLAPDELEETITLPAAAAGVGFEAGLVAEIIADANSQPGSLPLLQFALTQAFDRSSGPTISIEDYRSVGGLAGALGHRAESLLQEAESAEQAACRRLFGRLVALGEGTEDTRRRLRRSELPNDPQTDAAIERFGKARLLTFDRDAATREPTIEIAHEALIREWPRMRSWMDDDRDIIRTHRHLTTASTGWTDRDRDPNELYRGARLVTGEPLLTSDTISLNSTEADFLQFSITARAEEEAAEHHRLKRLHRLVAATAVVAVFALIAGAVAFNQKGRADDQAALAADNANQAVANAEQAAASAALADQRADEAQLATAQGDLERLRAVALAGAEESPSLSALLALESHRVDPTVESLDVLHRVLTESPGFLGSLASGDYGETELFDDGVTLAAATPESIELWDLRTRTLTGSIAHAGLSGRAWIEQIDRNRIAAVSSDRTQTMVHDVIAQVERGVLTHASLVNDITISPDGSRLAAAIDTGVVEIWDLSKAELLGSFDTGDPDLVFIRWSPVGNRLAAVTLSSQVQMWDADERVMVWSTESEAADLVNEVRPSAVSFSPAGNRLVVVGGSLAGALRTLNTSDGSEAVAPIQTLDTKGFIRDEIYWTGPDTLGIPSGGNVLTFDLASASAMAPALEEFKQTGRSIKYSSALDQFVVAGRSGLEFWSADGSGPLERVIPLAAEHQAAKDATGGSILTSLAADGSQLLISVFSNPPTDALLYDLKVDSPVGSAFTSGGSVTIGYGEYTLFGAGFLLQVLDSDYASLGPPVPLPFDFTELGVSEDGRFMGFGRLGGHADVYRNNGELLGTVSVGDPAEFAGAQTAPWFTSDGKFMAVTTVGRGSGLWSTDPLERVDLPAEFEDGWVHGLGPWLFVKGEDGTAQRLDPSTMAEVGVPISLNGFESLGYPKIDETNMRFAANNGEVVKIFDLATGRQLGRELPHSTNIADRIELSGDGTILSVPTEDRVTLWNYDTDTWAEIACEFAGRNMTREEWDQFGPRTVEYRATCPQFGLP